MNVPYSPDSLERVACALCGGADEEPAWEKDGFRVVRCRRCGLVYVNPRLSMEALTDLYNRQVISYTSYYVRWARVDELTFGARLDFIERAGPPGRLLELGCGPGTLMRVARSRGWQVRGIDVNAESVRLAREAGLEVACGTFPHPAFEGAEFDVAVMNDFIEHLPDPLATLAAVRAALAPGGLLFLTTPDVGSPLARLAGRRWPHLKPNEHLVYFDRRTLRELLARSGFEVCRIRSMGRVRNLALAIERLQEYSWKLHRLARALVPARLAERIDVPINPGDEMAVLARRADGTVPGTFSSDSE